jgi:hypothetical protein
VAIARVETDAADSLGDEASPVERHRQRSWFRSWWSPSFRDLTAGACNPNYPGRISLLADQTCHDMVTCEACPSRKMT